MYSYSKAYLERAQWQELQNYVKSVDGDFIAVLASSHICRDDRVLLIRKHTPDAVPKSKCPMLLLTDLRVVYGRTLPGIVKNLALQQTFPRVAHEVTKRLNAVFRGESVKCFDCQNVGVHALIQQSTSKSRIAAMAGHGVQLLIRYWRTRDVNVAQRNPTSLRPVLVRASGHNAAPAGVSSHNLSSVNRTL